MILLPNSRLSWLYRLLSPQSDTSRSNGDIMQAFINSDIDAAFSVHPWPSCMSRPCFSFLIPLVTAHTMPSRSHISASHSHICGHICNITGFLDQFSNSRWLEEREPRRNMPLDFSEGLWRDRGSTQLESCWMRGQRALLCSSFFFSFHVFSARYLGSDSIMLPPPEFPPVTLERSRFCARNRRWYKVTIPTGHAAAEGP